MRIDLAMLFVHHQETYPLPRLDQGDDSKAFPGLGSRRRSPASGGRWLPEERRCARRMRAPIESGHRHWHLHNSYEG